MRAKYVTLCRASGEGIAERWKNTYFRDGEWKGNDFPNGSAEERREVWEKLSRLGKSLPPAVVDEIIGNKSWTHIWCKGCNSYCTEGVAMGENGGEHTYCRTCIEEALELLNE